MLILLKKLVDDYLKRSWVYEAVAFGKLAGIIVLLPTRPETLEIVNLSVSKKISKTWNWYPFSPICN